MTDAAAVMGNAAAEEALWFEVEQTPVFGILHPVQNRAPVAVLIIVGGPQYRVGSHRQFVLLARALANAGFPVLRYDYRGMGDSDGEARDFLAVEADVDAAVAVLKARTGAARVVLWGLCDAASAALMYIAGGGRPDGLVLANPWVHNERSEAQVRLRSYYVQRLMSRDLWRKLFKFEFDYRGSAASLFDYWRRARAPTTPATATDDGDFIARMLHGLEVARCPIYLLLSGDDLTAGEFEQLLAESSQWRDLISAKCRETVRLPSANHTFARREWRDVVAAQSVAWLKSIVAS